MNVGQQAAALEYALAQVARFSEPEPDGDGGVIGADFLLATRWQTVAQELQQEMGATA